MAATLQIAAPAAAREPQPPLPSFPELEAAGATICEIRVVSQDIFDTDPEEDRLLFQRVPLHRPVSVAAVRVGGTALFDCRARLWRRWGGYVASMWGRSNDHRSVTRSTAGRICPVAESAESKYKISSQRSNRAG